ncbi:NUDIX domain-containing protein [Streptomyces sp. L2]|uniref:nucleotide triphosphate diphosphatase NUDT15 n=1 Tax=Streptomyces sp. L2 TaxID=2162665 RepID=UPI0010101C1D|nr:NUDIX domain-containing protein [Streptomyces sp. L2]
MTSTVGVGVLLIGPDGRILIGRRIKRGETPTWCLPGGHVEPGETFEEAALREVEEETGIPRDRLPEIRAFAVTLRTDVPDTSVTGCVVAHTDGPLEAALTEPDVFAEWRWVHPETPPTPLYPATEALLATWLGETAPAGWTVYPVPTTVPRRVG